MIKPRILLFLVAVLGVALAGPAPAADQAFALRDGDRVVFYGDSITQNGGYAQFVEQYVRSRYPDWKLYFYNAGVGGDTVSGGWAGDRALRLERDVIQRQPTVVTVMLGMNDGRYRPLEPVTRQEFADGYRAIVVRLRQALPQARLYLIRPSPFDDYARAPDFAPGYDDVLRQLGDVIAALGAEYQIPVVDFGPPLREGIRRVAAENPDLAAQLLPDRVHPSPAAHLVMGAALLRAWHAPAVVTRVELDAAVGAVRAAENTRVEKFAVTGGKLEWEQLDRALPLPLSYTDADTTLAQRAGADLESLDRQWLVVTGLTAARYRLRIDDREFGPFTAAELTAGINLARDNTPMRWQAYQVRWSTESAHERMRVMRSALPDRAGTPDMTAAVAALLAREASDQDARSQVLAPKPRRFSLTPVP